MADVFVKFCRWVFNASPSVVKETADQVGWEVDQEVKRAIIALDDWEVIEEPQEKQ